MNGIPIDLSDIEVFPHLRHFCCRDMVRCAPDSLGRFMMVGQRLPVRAVDERHNAPGSFGGAAVVLTFATSAETHI